MTVGLSLFDLLSSFFLFFLLLLGFFLGILKAFSSGGVRFKCCNNIQGSKRRGRRQKGARDVVAQKVHFDKIIFVQVQRDSCTLDDQRNALHC